MIYLIISWWFICNAVNRLSKLLKVNPTPAIPPLKHPVENGRIKNKNWDKVYDT